MHLESKKKQSFWFLSNYNARAIMQLQLYAYFSHVRFTIFFGFQFSFTASDQALVLAQENIKKTASID